jgi:hypothetical protein
MLEQEGKYQEMKYNKMIRWFTCNEVETKAIRVLHVTGMVLSLDFSTNPLDQIRNPKTLSPWKPRSRNPSDKFHVVPYYHPRAWTVLERSASPPIMRIPPHRHHHVEAAHENAQRQLTTFLSR